jgi:hypothetical protein
MIQAGSNKRGKQMKIQEQLISKMGDQSGVTVILVAIVLALLISIAALAVDIGYVLTTRNELQNVADATALAATRQLGVIYEGMPFEQHQTYVCGSEDSATIKGAAIDVALANKAGGENINLSDGDIEIGTWKPSATTPSERFTATLNQPDAVRTTARRGNGGANGPITTFFAKIFGVNTVDVSADAIAALTPQGTTVEGELELPIGISKYKFLNDYCDQPIRFYPTGDIYGCAGWNTFIEDPPNADTLGNILEGLTPDPPTYESPATTAGDTEVEFIGGNIASVFPELEALFMAKSQPTATPEPLYIAPQDEPLLLVDSDYPGGEPILDADGNHKHKRTWQTAVVVYDSEDCSNPNQAMTVVGYATVEMWAVNGGVIDPPHAKFTIFGKIVCDSYSEGRGGGGEYGTKGTIPNLVE